MTGVLCQQVNLSRLSEGCNCRLLSIIRLFSLLVCLARFVNLITASDSQATRVAAKKTRKTRKSHLSRRQIPQFHSSPINESSSPFAIKTIFQPHNFPLITRLIARRLCCLHFDFLSASVISSRDSCVSENKQKRESLKLSLPTRWAVRATRQNLFRSDLWKILFSFFSRCTFLVLSGSLTKNHARQLCSTRVWPQIWNKLIRQRRRVVAFIWANFSSVHLKFTLYFSLSLFAESYEVEVYSLFLKLYTLMAH